MGAGEFFSAPMATPLYVQLFARLVIRWEGADVTKAIGQPAAHLLAYLALNIRALPRREVARILWEETEAGDLSLRQALHKLKFVCGEELITALEMPDGLLLPRSLTECDLWDWERSFSRARERDIDSAWEAVCAPLSDGLFNGKGAEWLELESLRPRWNRYFADALRQRAAREQPRDTAAAEGFLRRAQELAPTAEAVARDLMTLLVLEGRREEVPRIYEALKGALAPQAPTPETKTHIDRLLREPLPQGRVPALPTRPVPPAPLTRLLARPNVLEAVRRRLDSNRLVQIVGSGGMGKTRLSLETLRRYGTQWRDGAAFVPLSTLSIDSDADAIADRTARALGLDTRTPTALLRRLNDTQLLLVLDNAEHVRAATADFVRQLLLECPGLSVLVTTREPLGVSSEEEVYLLPELQSTEATALFTLRAADVTPGDPELKPLTPLLHGIPLAIELAAARVRELGSVGALRERLESDSGVRELRRAGNANTDDERRHQTMEVMLRWSLSLLTPVERSVFLTLGVFRGGATDAALAFVAGLPLTVTRKAAVRLGRVSLARRMARRTTLLELVRQLAVTLAEEQGRVALLQERHIAWFTERARNLGNKSGEEVDDDNLQLALERSLDRGDRERAFPLAGTLWPRWRARGGVAYGVTLLDLALELSDSPGDLWMGRGILKGAMGLLTQVEADFREAEQRFRIAGEERRIPALQANWANLALEQGDLDAAEARFKQAHVQFLALGDQQRAAMVTGSLGRIAKRRGDLNGAIQHHQNARVALRAQGAHADALLEANNIASILQLKKDLPGAAQLLRETWTEAQALGNFRAVLHALALGTLGAVTATDWTRAATLVGVVEAQIERSNLPLPPGARADWAKALEQLEIALGAAEFEVLRHEGRELPSAEAGLLF